MNREADEKPYWSQEAEAALRSLGTSRSGLSSDEAAARLRRDGPNTFGKREQTSAAKLLLRQFESPLVLILVFASVVALVLRDWTEASIVLAIVLGSTALGFSQEYHASRAIEALRALLALNSRVIRDGTERAIPAAEIVVGDIIVLSAGNLIPADGLIIEARDFLVAEAILTGESFPVEKSPGALAPATELDERKNCAFAGASVRSGEAKIAVEAVADKTLFGAVAARLRSREPETEFARGLRRFGYLLLRVMIVLVIFVLTINQVLGRPFMESLLFSVALAVGLSPELLPAIVSVTLSAGARRLAQRGVLVRRLEAIEILGGVDILCTDKTGTLTEGAVGLENALDAEGEPSPSVMRLALANATLETGIKNPLDEAIVATGLAQGLTAPAWRKVDEIPYDFQRKRLTVVVDDRQDDTRLIITKGAFDQMLSVCTAVATKNGEKPLDAQARANLEARYRDYGVGGLRALALATRRAPAKDDFTRDDEGEMTFGGFLIFMDPPKADARDTLTALGSAGVKVKIITGDNRYVAAHVAGAMGLNAAALLRGEDVDAIKGDALLPIVERTDVFAEIDPQQKERIVRALQKNNHAVAFLGDGVNDAPALRAADVGISVDGAVDVAREAADIILLQRDLGILQQGIEDGRRTFANTLKYICITTGSSFGNMVSMALATPFLPFLPLTATQVLLTNFLTDLPLMAVTTDKVDPERVEKPLRWSVRDIQAFMLVFGLLSSAFDLATFFLLRGVFHADAASFQTSWFIVSVLTELVALLVLRTQRPAWKSRPGRWLVWLSAAVTVAILTTPLIAWIATPLGLQLPSIGTIASALVIVVAYGFATEAVKARFFQRRQHLSTRTAQ